MHTPPDQPLSASDAGALVFVVNSFKLHLNALNCQEKLGDHWEVICNGYTCKYPIIQRTEKIKVSTVQINFNV